MKQIVTPALIDRWRADRARGLSLQRIALRDGVSDWTVRRYTSDVAAPRQAPRKPSLSRSSGTDYGEPAYLAERPMTRLRQKLVEMREREP